ncbi:MAG: LamB/YcsF family protein [Pseudomonadota bacterium]
MRSIDLNADVGEGYPFDAELMQVVSSCSIACGGHVGDDQSISETLDLAKQHGVSAGAHPSYPDPDGFGRRSNFSSGEVLEQSLAAQLNRAVSIAEKVGWPLRHLKPHGALYNEAARSERLAQIILKSALSYEIPAVMGPPQSMLSACASEAGLTYIEEGFIDRQYTPSGQLLRRSEPGAVLGSIEERLQQAEALATGAPLQCGDQWLQLSVKTLCLHGDDQQAVETARAVRRHLEAAGIKIRAWHEAA